MYEGSNSIKAIFIDKGSFEFPSDTRYDVPLDIPPSVTILRSTQKYISFYIHNKIQKISTFQDKAQSVTADVAVGHDRGQHSEK